MSLPLPPHHDPEALGRVFRVPYAERASEARGWAEAHGITPAAEDGTRTALLLVDVQNTFCLPEFELFVGGRSGTAALEDNERLCAFLYRNLGRITQVVATLFRMIVEFEFFWKEIKESRPSAVFGFGLGAGDEVAEVNVNTQALFDSFQKGASDHGALWERVLSADTMRMAS